MTASSEPGISSETTRPIGLAVPSVGMNTVARPRPFVVLAMSFHLASGRKGSTMTMTTITRRTELAHRTSDGIDDSRTGGGFLEVYDCTIINNSGNGIGVNPSSGSTQINVHIYNSKISGNGSNGFFAGSNVHATIFNSVFTQNVSAGIFAQQTAGGNTDVNVDHCVASNNVTGFQANTGSSTIRVSNTTALGNSNLAVSGGGLISSYGNNQTGGVAFPSLPTGQS